MTAAEHDRELRSRLYGWLAARTSTPGGDEWEHEPLRLLVVDLLDLIEGHRAEMAGRLADAVLSDSDLSEPPAETQQDDETERAARAMHDVPAQQGVYGRIPWERLTDQHREAYRAMYRAALAARPSADAETLREALRLIAGSAPHCSASTSELFACRQPISGRTRGARYMADAWCDQCIARAALDADQQRDGAR